MEKPVLLHILTTLANLCLGVGGGVGGVDFRISIYELIGIL